MVSKLFHAKRQPFPSSQQTTYAAALPCQQHDHMKLKNKNHKVRESRIFTATSSKIDLWWEFPQEALGNCTSVGLIYRWMHSINKQHINGIKEPTRGYQNSNTSQIFIFGGYVKVRESLYTRVIIWVSNILDHSDTRAIFPGYESFLHGI